MEGDIITMSELFKFERQDMDEDGNVIGDLVATGVVPKFFKSLRHKGIDLPIDVFEHSWARTGTE